jgi:hypothetical protein
MSTNCPTSFPRVDRFHLRCRFRIGLVHLCRLLGRRRCPRCRRVLLIVPLLLVPAHRPEMLLGSLPLKWQYLCMLCLATLCCRRSTSRSVTACGHNCWFSPSPSAHVEQIYLRLSHPHLRSRHHLFLPCPNQCPPLPTPLSPLPHW